MPFVIISVASATASTRAARTAWLMAASALAGCYVDIPTQTAGRVGCPADAIHVVEVEETFPGLPHAWTVECRGAEYHCATHGEKLHCAPMPPLTAGGEEAGCHYDTQCKGDRLCREGRCSDP